MKDVTPKPAASREPCVPPGVDRDSYLQGRFDARLEEAERNHWRSKGFHIDPVTGKLVEIERVSGEPGPMHG